LLWDARSHIRLDILNGSLLGGRLQGAVLIDRLDRVDASRAAIRRLLRSASLGRLVPRPVAGVDKISRSIMALRLSDARAGGASLRDLADILVGPTRAARDWRDTSDFLHSRVRRMLRFGEHMSKAGWRDLLKNPRRDGDASTRGLHAVQAPLVISR